MGNGTLFRNLIIYTLGLISLQFATSRAGELTHPEKVAAQLFDTWCLEHEMNLKAIDRKAAEAQYTVVMDRRIPLKNGQSSIQKNWVIPLSDGETLLLDTTEVTNGSLHV